MKGGEGAHLCTGHDFFVWQSCWSGIELDIIAVCLAALEPLRSLPELLQIFRLVRLS